MNYTVAVRALCEFTAKCGDLDLRFTPAPSAQEGIAGHATVRGRRGAGYKAEVSLEGEYGPLRVRGRADGFDAKKNRVEEIKTYRGSLERMPDNHRQLHWAQAKIYGWLLCQKLDLDAIEVALVYFDIGEQTETVLCERHEAATLRQFFEQSCERFLAWAEQEMAHRAELDTVLRELGFPYPEFRTGQRELAEAAYKAAAVGCAVMMQAPTGIGKTVGTLFPLLKAKEAKQLDKIFYLAAKTSGRQLALDALDLIAGGKPLRVLELVARDKACEHPDKACHGDSCPLARGFYDRLPAARGAMLQEPRFDKAALRRVALEHEVCPYYLGQEMARWADVTVGDYNYYFDISAMLHGMTMLHQWRVAVLVDEAHNLVERGRKMYSAELHQADLKALRAAAPAEVKGALDRVNRQWNALTKEQEAEYQVYPAIPDKFLEALEQANGAMADYLVAHADGINAELQRFYFDIGLFVRLAEAFGEHTLFDVEKPNKHDIVLNLRNIVPAPFLKPRFAAAHASVLFSATLAPWQFYGDMLGLPEETPWIDVASPFRAEQLAVSIERRISTRWRDRDASLAPIADLIARHYKGVPGNYLAFFSSFDYLQRAADLLESIHPDLPIWRQSRDMDEAAKQAFLARFTSGGRGIGFAVLGGAFGEGIDLPGDRLIGAFIATLGLPQFNAVNEQIRERMQEMFGAGYEYAYLYPGLQKVVQAAGRVIRTTSDRGTVTLIDDRFAAPQVRGLLPGWWDVGVV
ncbi:MAG TPA: ATP-dependent DNA helicase [Burkholderiaceae bacterium]